MLPRPSLDLRLYAILDPDRCRERPLADMAAAAAGGGATLIQLRAKTQPTRALIEAAAAVKAALAPHGVPLLINDRVDVALAAAADGVHVGADDIDPTMARGLLGPNALIGVTVHHGAEADLVDPTVVDYASMGPVFATGSKVPKDPPIGPAGIGALIGRLRHRLPDYPCCVISGITRETAPAVIAAGADGVAVIAELFMADDVAAAARALRRAVDDALAVPTPRAFSPEGAKAGAT